MENHIIKSFRESARITETFFSDNIQMVIDVVNVITDAMTAGNKIMFFGNGGSAADAQHLTAEFVNRFQIERPPLPALALTTDTSVLTSIGNDYSFDEIFSKQIRALGKAGDVAIGITTSGSSVNVVKGLEQANKMNITTVAMLGKDGGNASKITTYPLIVASNNTPRIQETHIIIGHIICEMIDYKLFQRPYEK